VEVKQVQHESLTTPRYPWTHRIGFDDVERHNALPVLQWTEVNNIPGIWAGNAFYTTGKYATMIMIKWS
jgi:hypothetical protein